MEKTNSKIRRYWFNAKRDVESNEWKRTVLGGLRLSGGEEVFRCLKDKRGEGEF